MKHLLSTFSFLLCWLFASMSLAQTPCNDTLVSINDSMCEGQSYTFGNRTLTYEGVYYDTLPRVGSACDSVIILHLSVLDTFYVHPGHTTYCSQPVGYRLHGFGGSFYHSWTSTPVDSSLLSQQHATDPYVNPSQPTTYTLTIDYRTSSPQCPSSGSLKLNPVQVLSPALRVTPSVLTLDNLELTATDCSSGNEVAQYEGWAGRNWYFNGEKYALGNQSVTIQAHPWWGDTVEVMMEAFTPTCIDTLIRRIPFQRISVIFPNIIIPSQGEYLVPQLLGVVDYELWVYNRYGMLVFHTTDSSQSWDGTTQGKPCLQGAYVYKCRYTTIDAPTGFLIHAGTVTLIR